VADAPLLYLQLSFSCHRNGLNLLLSLVTAAPFPMPTLPKEEEMRIARETKEADEE
jgi:hypothetical protein